MLTAYRRHLAKCPSQRKGQHFSLCSCPIWAYGRLPDGRTIRQSLHTDDWPRAQRRIQLLDRGEGQAFLTNAPTGKTLGAAIEGYLADLKARNLKEGSLSTYAYLFAQLQAFFDDASAVSLIDTPLLDRFRASRTVKLKNGETRPVLPRTSNKEIRLLRSFFGWCMDRQYISSNTAKKVRLIKIEDTATLPFDREEVDKLILACEQITSGNPAEIPYLRHRGRALTYALLYSGLRIGDIARLRRASLDVGSRYLTLRITKTGVPLKVQLHADAVRCLDTLPSTNAEYFFWTGNGKINTLRKNLWRTISRIGQLAGVKAHPHRFRDTFAVELLANGEDIRTVQMLLGHTSVKTTEMHYAHFMPAQQKLLDAATAKLDFTAKRRPVLVKPLSNRRRNA